MARRKRSRSVMMHLSAEGWSGQSTRVVGRKPRPLPGGHACGAGSVGGRVGSMVPKRLPQLTLIVSTLVASWLGMQAVHELGHVLGAWLTGGRVARVVLHPLTISRTDLGHNPSPLAVVWAGPVFGALAPVLLWAV